MHTLYAYIYVCIYQGTKQCYVHSVCTLDWAWRLQVYIYVCICIHTCTYIPGCKAMLCPQRRRLYIRLGIETAGTLILNWTCINYDFVSNVMYYVCAVAWFALAGWLHFHTNKYTYFWIYVAQVTPVRGWLFIITMNCNKRKLLWYQAQETIKKQLAYLHKSILLMKMHHWKIDVSSDCVGSLA